MSEPSKFLYALTHLNRAPTKYGKAPHKPVLLLTLLELAWELIELIFKSYNSCCFLNSLGVQLYFALKTVEK